jgi:hypothetical protein
LLSGLVFSAAAVLVLRGSTLPENSTAMNKYVGGFGGSTPPLVQLDFLSRRQPSRIQDPLDDI